MADRERSRDQRALCFHPLAQAHLRSGQPQELLLVLDSTTQKNRVVLLTAAVWYRERALPVAWAVWPATTPLVGARFWARVAALLALVAGAHLARSLLAQPPSGRRRTRPYAAKVSLFRLGLHLWQAALFGAGDLPPTLWLDDWEAPAWQDQLIRRHARAFLFRPFSSVVREDC